jgi:hypothetical protein
MASTPTPLRRAVPLGEAPPTRAALARLPQTIARRVDHLLERQGLLERDARPMNAAEHRLARRRGSHADGFHCPDITSSRPRFLARFQRLDRAERAFGACAFHDARPALWRK